MKLIIEEALQRGDEGNNNGAGRAIAWFSNSETTGW